MAPETFKKRAALSSVNYRRNALVLMLLNRCLALTVLQAIEDVSCLLNSNLSSLESVLLFQGLIPFDGLSCNLFTCRLDNGI